MSRLYTYLPKDNTALTDGLLSTSLSDKGFEKYRGRTGKHTKEDVLKVLDSWEPEWTRSKAISALTEPIPPDAADDFLEFAKNRKLYSFSTKDLIKAKILAHLRRARNGGGTDPVDEVKKERLNWHRKKKHYLFQGIPHYFVETAGGKIPPEFVREEKKASDRDEKSLERARAFVAAVKKMALKRKLNMFLVTDGASGILNNGNPAVRNAREAQIKWELAHGHDPYEDWEHTEKKAVSFSRDGSTFQLTAGETPWHAVKAWNSANPGRKVTTRQVLSANPKVKATGYRVGTRYRTGLAAAAPAAKKPVVASAPIRASVSAPAKKAKVPAQPAAQRPEGTPIGYWNNNPGNLVSDGRTEWEGIRQILPKGKNMEFNDYGSGYRAMSRILYNYGAKHGIDTPLATVSRFAKSAPAAKKTEYANFLKSKTGWGPDDKIDLTKEETLQKLVPSMASFEIGPAWTARHDPSVVSNAVTRAIPPK